jgi:tryptophan synthase alpha chain
VALDNGMNIGLLFDQIKNLRMEVQIPVLLMGYFNSIYQFGVEKFCQNCQSVGIDGLIRGC